MMLAIITVYSVIVTGIAISFVFWDIGNFIKMGLSLNIGRFFQRKYQITETTVQYGICTTRDVDLLFTHMNNARCLRAMDFARNHFMERTDIYDKVAAAKGRILVSAATIRYRKPLHIFSFYKIETKMLCWENQSIFLEHKLITLKDNFVRAIVLSRVHIVGLDLPSAMEDVRGAENMKTFPEEVVQWQLYLDISSAKLKKQGSEERSVGTEAKTR